MNGLINEYTSNYIKLINYQKWAFNVFTYSPKKKDFII